MENVIAPPSTQDKKYVNVKEFVLYLFAFSSTQI